MIFIWAGILPVAHAAAPVPAGWWTDIANDRVDDIRGMLQQGADPNAVSPEGQPSIMLAIRNSAWHVYDLLAANPKTKVNVTNRHDETPLMYLAVVGQTQRAQGLIARGADVNRLGWTPLHYAASTGKLDTARMLIAHKALVNAPGPDGTTPLMMAAYSGSQPMVQLLIDAGADVTTRNLDKHNAADWARRQGFADLADKIDVLIKQVQAKRQARRAHDILNQAQTVPVPDGGAPAQAGASQPSIGQPATDQVKTVDIVPAPKAVPPPAPKPPVQGNGTSQYFNSGDFSHDPGH